MHEDLSKQVVLNVRGVNVHMQQVERDLLALQGERAEIVYAQCGGEVVGLLVYHVVADCVLYIRAEYVDSKFIGERIGFEMVTRCLPHGRIKRVIFKTNNEETGSEILEIAKKHAQLLEDQDGFKTWEMGWKYG